MSDYSVLELGPISSWGEAVSPSGASGKRFIDKEMAVQFIGTSANLLQPGQSSPVWHSHSVLEEVYIFLTGRGRMGLDDEVVEVCPGTTIRVGQGVMRAVHADADAGEPLSYLCVRAAGQALADLAPDSQRDDRPYPW